MTVDVRWFNDDERAVLNTYHPNWTWIDWDNATDTTYTLIRSKVDPVDVIADIRLAPNPPTASAIGHFQRALKLLPTNLGAVIVIGSNRFLQHLGTAFTRAFTDRQQRIHFVKTMDDVSTLLEKLQNERYSIE